MNEEHLVDSLFESLVRSDLEKKILKLLAEDRDPSQIIDELLEKK